MFRRFRRSPQPQLQAETAAATPYNNSNNKNDDIAAAAATVSELPNTPQKPHYNNNDETVQPHMPSVRSTSGSDMASHSEADEEDDDHILHTVDHTCKPPLLRPQKSRSTSPAAAAAAAAGTTTTTRVLPSSLPYSSDWSLITSPADLSPPIGIGPTRQQQQSTSAGHQGSHQPQLFVTVGPPANAEAPNQMEEWATMTPTLSYCHVSSSSPPPNAERQQEEENDDERMQGEVHTRHDSETTTTTTPPATEVKRRFGMAAAASLLPRSPALSSPMTSLFVRLLPVSPSTETCTSAAHASRCAAPTTTTSSSTIRANKMNSGVVAAPATIVRMPALSEGSVSTETAAQSLEESPFIAAPSFAPSMASVLHASESCEPAPRVSNDIPSHESNWTSAGKTRMLRTRSVCGGAGVVSDCVLWLWQVVREDVLYHWYPQLLLVLGNREVRYAGQGRIRHRSKSAMTGRGADGVPRWECRPHKRRRCVSPDACGGNSSEEDIQMSWHWSLSSDTVATAVHSFLIFLL